MHEMGLPRLGVSACAALMAAALVGCRPSPVAPSPVAPPTASIPDAEPAEAPVVQCGPRGERFAALGWVPAEARVLATVELANPELEQATATLREGTQDTAHKLPIRTAFSLGQWTWQLPLLRRTLEDAGFYPDELVFMSLPDGTSVWAWPSSCDLETATRIVGQSWRLDLRTTPYGALATAPRDDAGTPLFAYDLIVWGASFFALVPAGRGPGTAQQLGQPRLSQTTHPAEAIGSIEAAPLRLVTRTDDLMAPGGATAQDTLLGHRILEGGWTTVAVGLPRP